jgi:hypothetical protein
MDWIISTTAKPPQQTPSDERAEGLRRLRVLGLVCNALMAVLDPVGALTQPGFFWSHHLWNVKGKDGWA